MGRWLRSSLAFLTLCLAGCSARNSSISADGASGGAIILRPTPSAPSNSDLAQLYAVQSRLRDAIVEIRTEYHEPPVPADEDAEATIVVKESGGSGIAIDADGLILTNAHVISGATFVFVRVGDQEVPARQIARHDRLDLALLTIDVPLPHTLIFDETPVGPGLPVLAISGVPEQRSGATGVVTRTRVSLQDAIDPQGQLDYGHLIECSTPLRPGFSGGAIVASDGRWIGISVAAAETPDRKEARGYAIPLDDDTRAAIKELRGELSR